LLLVDAHCENKTRKWRAYDKAVIRRCHIIAAKKRCDWMARLSGEIAREIERGQGESVFLAGVDLAWQSEKNPSAIAHGYLEKGVLYLAERAGD
jgi:hypothetical protein